MIRAGTTSGAWNDAEKRDDKNATEVRVREGRACRRIRQFSWAFPKTVLNQKKNKNKNKKNFPYCAISYQPLLSPSRSWSRCIDLVASAAEPFLRTYSCICTVLRHLIDKAELGQFDRDAVDEPSRAGTEEERPHERGDASGHMDNPAPREVKSAAVEQEVRLPVSGREAKAEFRAGVIFSI